MSATRTNGKAASDSESGERGPPMIGGPLLDSGWAHWLPLVSYRLFAGIDVDRATLAWEDDATDPTRSVHDCRSTVARKRAVLEAASGVQVNTVADVIKVLEKLHLCDEINDEIVYSRDLPSVRESIGSVAKSLGFDVAPSPTGLSRLVTTLLASLSLGSAELFTMRRLAFEHRLEIGDVDQALSELRQSGAIKIRRIDSEDGQVTPDTGFELALA